jgi:hypothetical protein
MEGSLNGNEKMDLQKRRRAAEPEGSMHAVVPAVSNERAELEARRKGANSQTGVRSS